MLVPFWRLVQPLRGRQLQDFTRYHPNTVFVSYFSDSRSFYLRCLSVFLRPSAAVAKQLSAAYGGRGLTLNRSYTRRTSDQHELEVTIENEATEAALKDDKKKKKKRKRTQKKTEPKPSVKDDFSMSPAETHDMPGIELNFPFEGTLNKPESPCLLESLTQLQNPSEDTTKTFSIHIHKNSTNSESNARTYSIQKDDEIFFFPSVTTILSHTLPKRRGFMLSNWKRNLVKEFGEDGYLQVRDQIRELGIRFHSELESQLHRPHLLSVKPQTHLPPPHISTSHSHPPSQMSSLPPPLPPPLPFPPKHRKRFPIASTSSQVVMESDSGDDVQMGTEGGVCEEEEVVVESDLGDGVQMGMKGGVCEEEQLVVENDLGDDVQMGMEGNKCEENGKENDHMCSDNHAVASTSARSSVTDGGTSTGYLQSVQHVLADISEVYVLESAVAHMELGYSGTCDCIATYRDSVCLIDWKTSSKPRPLTSDLYDYPLQAVAYAGAVNQDPHYPFKVKNVLIVTAYPSGEPCHAHLLTLPHCQEYWSQWLARLLQYQTLFASDLGDVCL